MAITAKFTADFDDFNRDVKKAEVQLDLFEKEAGQAGTALGTLTTTTRNTGTQVNSVTSAYKQFDGALSAAGINIGATVRGLEDMSAAAGKTIGQLGLLTTAGLTVGAAMTGWNFGRAIAGYFDLDRAIGENLAKWMGWGDVAKETAGAVSDALTLASQRAGRPITDMTEAIRINAQFMKDRNKTIKEDAEALKEWEKANSAVVIASQNHSAILAKMNPQVVEATKFALDHGVSQKDVATAYKLTAPEIAAVNWQLEQEVIRLKEVEAWNKLVADAMKTHWDGVGDVVDQVLGVDALKAATTWTDAIDAMGGSVANLRANELEQLKTTMLAGIDALARMGQLTTEQSSHFANLAAAADTALAALRPQVTVTEDLSKAMWDYVRALDAEAEAQRKAGEAATEKAAGDEQRAKAMTSHGKGKWKDIATTITPGTTPGAFGQLTTAWGLSGRIGQTALQAPIGGHAGQTLAGGAGGMWWTPTTNIVINGSVLGNKDEIARVVGDAVTSSYRSGGNRLPV